MPETKRFRHRRSLCGYAEREGFNGEVVREVIVAGGAAESFAERASEILDLVRRKQLKTGRYSDITNFKIFEC